ncbi:hypothetical protein N7490_000007 [Penicillium lividum]|nr:hypothetical protein N7490_000007 [Penicillium lividum]
MPKNVKLPPNTLPSTSVIPRWDSRLEKSLPSIAAPYNLGVEVFVVDDELGVRVPVSAYVLSSVDDNIRLSCSMVMEGLPLLAL